MGPAELRGRRESLHLTQAQLARALGVARNTVARWERGELTIRQPELVALALQRLEIDQRLDADATPSQGSPSNNLPPELTTFIGRERELCEFRDLLRKNRLLTITGAGGAGKTRLAQRLAYTVLADYSDGAWFSDLAPLTSPALVSQAVAGVFGLREQSGRRLLATVGAGLGQRQALLVLDNCEHVLDGAAELVAHLLRAAPALHILATSRAPLGVVGETVRPLAPLPVPPLNDRLPWDQLLQVPSVRLLQERAAAHASYVADPRDAAALAEICRRLDGLPLALELAAARLAVVSPVELASRLEATFRLLVDTQRDAPARHHTLWATLDWSHALLAPAEQCLFARLAVFAGGWTLEACEQVVGGAGIEPADVLELLSELVAKSLVVVEPSPDGRVRYRFLEMVQQYARERLQETPDESWARARHRHWFLACAERFNAAVHGPTEAIELARLDPELDNLRAALEWRARDTTDLDHGLVVAGRLWWFWQARGYFREGREHTERLLAQAGPGVAPASRAEALIGAGMLAWNQGSPDDLAAARELMTKAMAIARELGDKHLLINAMAGLARPIREQGDVDFARRLLAETLELAETIGDRWRYARTLNGLGILAMDEGDFVRAADWFQQSLVSSREQRDDVGVATQLGNLARMAFQRRDLHSAISFATQAMAMRREQHVRGGYPLVRNLEVCAAVAARYRLAESAARLDGAADTLREQSEELLELGPKDFTQRYQRDLASARAQLGAEAFAQARSAGRGLNLDEAVSEALALPGALSAAPERSPSLGALTARESEVARLVGRGFTNQQIANELVFTEATAAKHVEHILDKLGFTSRTQIAAWVAAASPEVLAQTVT